MGYMCASRWLGPVWVNTLYVSSLAVPIIVLHVKTLGSKGCVPVVSLRGTETGLCVGGGEAIGQDRARAMQREAEQAALIASLQEQLHFLETTHETVVSQVTRWSSSRESLPVYRWL